MGLHQTAIGKQSPAVPVASPFFQTSPRGDALALRYHFTSLTLCRGLAPRS